MRLSVPASLIGTLGALVQRAIGGINALAASLWPYTYGTAFKSVANMTLNTSEQVFSAASNVNGAIVWRAAATSFNAAGMAFISLIAHTAAPNSATVGDVIASQDGAGLITSNVFSWAKLELPVLIPAGKGLFWNVGTTETGAYRSVLYTLL